MKKQKEYHPSMQPYLDGQVILFDKPLKWTSFDIIKKVRYQTRIAKVGHAGTLDPLATGLLIVCTGKFTKQINDYMGMEKEYTGTITLGATTPTFDLESEPTNFISLEHITAQKCWMPPLSLQELLCKCHPCTRPLKRMDSAYI